MEMMHQQQIHTDLSPLSRMHDGLYVLISDFLSQWIVGYLSALGGGVTSEVTAACAQAGSAGSWELTVFLRKLS